MTGVRDSYVEDNFKQVVAAFKVCGWKSVFVGDSEGYLASKSSALFKAATKAEEDGEKDRGRALRLLAEASSMMLSSDCRNNPFGPSFQTTEGRSIVPSDFTDAEIEFFTEITDAVDEPTLKGRLADLVWVRRVPRDVKYALQAIDNYTQAPPSRNTWYGDGEKCWNRAINLAHMIGKGAGNRLGGIESSIISSIETSSTDEKFFAFKLANTLESGGLGKSQSEKVAEKLRYLADGFRSAGNHYASGSYYSAAARWYKSSGNEPKSIEMIVAEAESFVSDADARLSSDDPSHAVAADFVEKSIQIYRSIPRVQRDIHDVDERIRKLRIRHSEHGEKALEQMATISSASVEITDSIAMARAAVSGKESLEALVAFANLYRININQLRQQALDSLDQFPLRSLFPTVIMGADGRTIARPPRINRSTPTEENEEAILAEMTNTYYRPILGIVTQSLILPALDVLVLEQRFQTGDFIELARRSPIVPVGREVLVGKALYEGFNRNFDIAIHVLAPQIEHIVRTRLKFEGVSTTHLDKDGIETENGLSSLVDLPKTKEIFGSDLTYEIRALFCDSIGPNLRNNVAHGLLDDQQAQSLDSAYAWWFVLRLVFNLYWSSLVTDSDGESQEQTDDDESSSAAGC